jgi:hypothetical protein
MEEFIYILVGVIWLGASIYKASQKRKQKSASQNPSNIQSDEDPGPKTARSLFEELISGQDMHIPEPEIRELSIDEQISVDMEEEPVKSFQSEYASFGLKGLETVSGEGVSSAGRITFKDELKELTKTKPGQSKIDLRKAIIYSAILERPYI